MVRLFQQQDIEINNIYIRKKRRSIPVDNSIEQIIQYEVVGQAIPADKTFKEGK